MPLGLTVRDKWHFQGDYHFSRNAQEFDQQLAQLPSDHGIMPDKRQDLSPGSPHLDNGLEETTDALAEYENSPTIKELDSIVRRSVVISKSNPNDENDQAFLQRISNLQFIRELADRLEVPEKIGSYRVLAPIGSGGMGQVFKVQHEVLGKVQALKRLPASRNNDPAALKRFKNEIATLGRLDHPNIVSAQYADEIDGNPYLIMDFIDGQTLAQLVEDYQRNKKPFPLELACELIYHVAVGIGYAHQQGIIHRDIKPANIILDNDGAVHILDLGLARLAENYCDSGSIAETEGLTRDQQILGTPDFMAPEQIRNSRDVDHRADIYSLGATLYYLLTGQVVHPAAKDSTLLNRAIMITQDDAPCIRKVRPDLPTEIADLISECLNKSPGDRLGSADELAERLKPFTQLAVAEPNKNCSIESKVHETKAGVNKEPPIIGRKWIAAAMLVPLLCLLTLILKIPMPGGGELIVECDDPNANIQVEFIQNGNEKAFKLEELKNRSVKFSNGIVRIQITGLDSDNYKLAEDHFTIQSGKKQVVSIRRVNRVVGPRESETNTDDSRNETVVSTRFGAGAILQPPVRDDVFDVQLMPHPGILDARHKQLGHTSDHFDFPPMASCWHSAIKRISSSES